MPLWPEQFAGWPVIPLPSEILDQCFSTMVHHLTPQTVSAIVVAGGVGAPPDSDDASAALLAAVEAVALEIQRLRLDLIRSTTSALRDPRVR